MTAASTAYKYDALTYCATGAITVALGVDCRPTTRCLPDDPSNVFRVSFPTTPIIIIIIILIIIIIVIILLIIIIIIFIIIVIIIIIIIIIINARQDLSMIKPEMPQIEEPNRVDMLYTRHIFLFKVPPTLMKRGARLAQSVEHETLNLRVVGSSPTLGGASLLLAD